MHKKLTLGFSLLVVGVELWTQQAIPRRPFFTDKQNLLVYFDDSGNQHPVRTLAEWEIRRAQILRNIQLVMGPLPTPSPLALDVKIEEIVETSTFRRERISFQGAEGDHVPAYLFIPKSREGRFAHQIHGRQPCGLEPQRIYAAHRRPLPQ